ncbi:MAG: hypothetical protein ACLQUT_10625 [Thermoleophilia bacterium]
MKNVTAAHRQPLFVSDCEGPLTRNDNAAELAAAYLPAGGDLFARLSKYDDVLADIIRKPGYNAGTTLAFMAPFLRAFGLDDAAVEKFSRETLVAVTGAVDLVAGVRALMAVFIISTSYTPYVRAVADLLGLPFANCRCTELSLDRWHLPRAEVTWLRSQAQWISQQPLLAPPADATSVDDLDADDRATIHAFDALFGSELEQHAPVAAEMVAAVHPVGGHGKLLALDEIIAATAGSADVMYVGDSVTDAPALAAVKQRGGVSLSFNGNRYALAAAEFAVAAVDAYPTLDLARAFAGGGVAASRRLARAWQPPAAATAGGGAHPQPGAIGGDSQPDTAALPRLGIIAEDTAALTAASRAARTAVRGEHLANLG